MNKPARRRTRSLTAALCLTLGLMSMLILMLSGSGCQTRPTGAEESLAWVRINHRSPQEISRIVDSVLLQNGYIKAAGKSDRMVFERPGNFGEHLLQGGFGSGVSIRMQIKITRTGDDSQLLHCRAFYVRNPGNPILEDSVAQWRVKSRQYQKLLDEVKRRLDEPDGGNGTPEARDETGIPREESNNRRGETSAPV